MPYRVLGGGQPQGVFASPEGAVLDAMARTKVRARIIGHTVEGDFGQGWERITDLGSALEGFRRGEGFQGVRIETIGACLPIRPLSTTREEVRASIAAKRARRDRRRAQAKTRGTG